MIVHFVKKDLSTRWCKKELSYKVPKISNKTDKGKWLNAFVKWFFVPHKDHDYHWKTAKNKITLKTTVFNINNNKGALVGFFKNLKKLKQHHFEGEVFNAVLWLPEKKEAA
jgi:hypothetical protein